MCLQDKYAVNDSWEPGRFDHPCLNVHSGPPSLKVTLNRRSCLQAPSLWDWCLCWWPACPAALQEFTLRKSSRRLNRACGSVTYSWVSHYGSIWVGSGVKCFHYQNSSLTHRNVCPATHPPLKVYFEVTGWTWSIVTVKPKRWCLQWIITNF